MKTIQELRASIEAIRRVKATAEGLVERAAKEARTPEQQAIVQAAANVVNGMAESVAKADEALAAVHGLRSAVNTLQGASAEKT